MTSLGSAFASSSNTAGAGAGSGSFAFCLLDDKVAPEVEPCLELSFEFEEEAC